MPYQYLLFDADNTLFDFNQCECIALKGAMENAGIEFLEDHHLVYNQINKSCWLAFEEGKLSKIELRSRRFELFLQAIGHRWDIDDFAEDYLSQLGNAAILIEGAEELLLNLQEDYELVLVTNGLKEVQRPRLAKAGLHNFFKSIVVSDEIGHAKPHAPFFDYVFDSIDRPDKSTVLIIGDNLNADIRGGLEYGIDACWYNPEKREKYLEVEPTYEITMLAEIKSLVR